MQWWNKEYIYQIYPRTFKDSNGDGIGDIKGITSKLDYLKELGVGGIWICPIYKSPMVDNGYDVSDYYNINKIFGTNSDFKELLKTAKKLDLKIIMDIVMNHTSNQHDWFKRALDGDKKFADYYIFCDYPGAEKSAFGGSAWEFVPKLNKYYFHTHAKEQPDLNWTNLEVRKEFCKIIDFWVNQGVMGFRFDVVDLIGKKIDGAKITYDTSLTHSYLKELNANSKMKDDSILKVGESVKFSVEDAIKSSTISEKELSMSFLFTHQGIDKHPTLRGWKPKKFDLVKLKNILIEKQVQFADNGWNSIFWNNHDGPRIVSRWGDTSSEESWKKSAKLIFTIGSFLRGTPYIFQGEEIGMTNHVFKDISEFDDLETIGKYNDLVKLEKKLSNDEFMYAANKMSREHGRTAMLWDGKKNASFSSSPKVIINNDFKKINVELEKSYADSILNYFKKIIEFRNNNSEFFANAKIVFTKKYIDHKKIFSFERVLGEKKYLIIANWSNTQVVLDEKFSFNKIQLTNFSISSNEDIDKLMPWEVIILSQ